MDCTLVGQERQLESPLWDIMSRAEDTETSLKETSFMPAQRAMAWAPATTSLEFWDTCFGVAGFGSKVSCGITIIGY